MSRSWFVYVWRTRGKGPLCRYAWRISETPVDVEGFLPWVDSAAPALWGFALTRRTAIWLAIRATRNMRQQGHPGAKVVYLDILTPEADA